MEQQSIDFGKICGLGSLKRQKRRRRRRQPTEEGSIPFDFVEKFVQQKLSTAQLGPPQIFHERGVPTARGQQLKIDIWQHMPLESSIASLRLRHVTKG